MKTLLMAFIFLFTQCNALACTKTLIMGTNETNWAPYLIKQGDDFVGTEVDTVNAILRIRLFVLNGFIFRAFRGCSKSLKLAI